MKSYLIVEVETTTDDQRKHDELVEWATSIIQDEGCGLTGFVDGWTVIGRRETRPRALGASDEARRSGICRSRCLRLVAPAPPASPTTASTEEQEQ